MRFAIRYSSDFPIDKFMENVSILEKKEAIIQDKLDSSRIRNAILEKFPASISRFVVSNPAFMAATKQSFQIWKLLFFDKEERKIIYEYDTRPVDINTLNLALEQNKRIWKKSDLILMFELMHKKMVLDGLKIDGLPESMLLEFKRLD